MGLVGKMARVHMFGIELIGIGALLLSLQAHRLFQEHIAGKIFSFAENNQNFSYVRSGCGNGAGADSVQGKNYYR